MTNEADEPTLFDFGPCRFCGAQAAYQGVCGYCHIMGMEPIRAVCAELLNFAEEVYGEEPVPSHERYGHKDRLFMHMNRISNHLKGEMV